jgi:hypothetical protein
MTIDTLAEAELSDRELVLQFESLGDNCELGLVQRMAGVEPLGMFRFASAPLRNVIRAMTGRFAGIAEPGQINIQGVKDEYMIHLIKYGFAYHVAAAGAYRSLSDRQADRGLGTSRENHGVPAE